VATHDYVIANGTGAAVRSDLNGALAAIVSQNSSATEPSPTYAYQRWADTTAGVMKMRNGANSAWITLYQLDGEWSTIAFENGTAAAPSIYFKDSGTDTGIYSPGADQVGISTGGTARITVDGSGNVNIDSGTFYVDAANNRVGLGTSSPSHRLHVVGSNGAGNTTIGCYGGSSAGDYGLLTLGTGSTDKASINVDATTNDVRFDTRGNAGAFTFVGNGYAEYMRLTSTGRLGIGTTGPATLLDLSTTTSAKLNLTYPGFGIATLASDSTGSLLLQADEANTQASSIIQFKIDGSEKLRIDSSSRLLVGTSTARGPGDHIARLQVEGTGYATSTASVFANSNDAFGSYVFLGKSRGTAVGSNTVVQSGDSLGQVRFSGTDGTGAISAAFIETFVDGTPGTNDMPGRLVFSTTADGAASPTERVRINRVGQISSYALAGAGNFNLFLSHGSAASSSTWMIAGAYGATDVNTGTASFLVATNGNVTNTNNSYGAISDAKLKENIVDATPQWDDLKALQVRKYNFKEGQTHTQIGLVAQEVELISPGLVTESPDRDAEGNDLGTVTKSVNYSVLYMKAVKALQEAMERIETLEASNADMLARLTALEAA
jgi:hypothetical protein